MDISRISATYEVRRLSEEDADSILELYLGNPQYFKYTEAEPTEEQVLEDLTASPPGIGSQDKYFLGLYKDERLTAVMDLINGYPDRDTEYIGFFMMAADLQGKGAGTDIIRELEEYLRTIGKTSVRLAIDKGNPQSTHFWTKNGFRIVKEVDQSGWIKQVAEKEL